MIDFNIGGMFKAIGEKVTSFLDTGDEKKRDSFLTWDEVRSLNLDSHRVIANSSFKELKVDVKKEDGKKLILLVDDEETTEFIYSQSFKRMEHLTEKKMEEDFQMIPIFTRTAGIKALSHIYTCGCDIDFAFLDLSLSYVYVVDDRASNDPRMIGKRILIDGVDLAIELHRVNPNIKFKFITSHSNDFDVSVTRPYKDKFFAYFQDDIIKYYISKRNSEKHIEIQEFLYKNKECKC